MVKESEKKNAVARLIRDSPPGPVMVFVNAKKNADSVARSLQDMGVNCDTLHSGKSQEGRVSVLEDFKSGAIDVMVCTDVAGRGIDIKGVAHVINYDCPKNIEDYTHRIGRTGRAGQNGLATTCVTPEDTHLYFDLKVALEAAKAL